MAVGLFQKHIAATVLIINDKDNLAAGFMRNDYPPSDRAACEFISD